MATPALLELLQPTRRIFLPPTGGWPQLELDATRYFACHTAWYLKTNTGQFLMASRDVRAAMMKHVDRYYDPYPIEWMEIYGSTPVPP